MLQQIVADRMTERIVDILEMIEIKAEHGDVVISLRAPQRLFKLFAE